MAACMELQTRKNINLLLWISVKYKELNLHMPVVVRIIVADPISSVVDPSSCAHDTYFPINSELTMMLS